MTIQTNERFGLPEHAIKKIQSILENHAMINQVVIYGSRAMGNHRTGSDIDLCIDSPSMTLTELFKIDNQIDDLLLPWKVDLSLKKNIDNPHLLEHINTIGIIFYHNHMLQVEP